MARRRRNGLARRNKFEEISSSRLSLGKAWNCRAKAEPASRSNQSGTIRPGNWRRDMPYCADGAATARLSLSAPKISTPARDRLGTGSRQGRNRREGGHRAAATNATARSRGTLRGRGGQQRRRGPGKLLRGLLRGLRLRERPSTRE